MNAATRFGRLSPSTPAGSEAEEEGHSLPAWIYHDPEFFEREKAEIFRKSWQVVCHLSDVPSPGDFHSFEFLGESIVVLRGDDSEVRAFHNVCRHRAARLLDFSVPEMFAVLAVAIAAWVLGNLAMGWAHRTPLDPPPFDALQGVATVAAVLVAGIVFFLSGTIGTVLVHEKPLKQPGLKMPLSARKRQP